MNQDIILAFQNKAAMDKSSAIFVEDLKLPYPMKVQYFLIEEFVRNGFMVVLEDGKVFFNQQKYHFEKKKVQITYMSILIVPFVIGLILLIT